MNIYELDAAGEVAEPTRLNNELTRLDIENRRFHIVFHEVEGDGATIEEGAGSQRDKEILLRAVDLGTTAIQGDGLAIAIAFITQLLQISGQVFSIVRITTLALIQKLSKGFSVHFG